MKINRFYSIILISCVTLIFGQTNSAVSAKLYQRAKSLEQAGLTDEALTCMNN